MLSEFAILPDVMIAHNYEHPDLAKLCLRSLFNSLEKDGVVRDLSSNWRNELIRSPNHLHPVARELMEFLVKHGRITPDVVSSVDKKNSIEEWLALAVNSHEKLPLDAIVAKSAKTVKSAPIVDVTELNGPDWSKKLNTESLHVACSLGGYTNALRKIARLSKQMIIIDPYLYPNSYTGNYKQFPDLLVKFATQNKYLHFDIHVKEQKNERVDVDSFMTSLKKSNWKGELRLFVWSQLHDRFILSNLIGLAMPKGLEILGRKETPRIWTRLSENHRKKIAEEHDPNLQRNKIFDRYTRKGK